MLLLDKNILKKWSVYLNGMPDLKTSFNEMLDKTFVTAKMYHEWYNKHKPEVSPYKLEYNSTMENYGKWVHVAYMHERIKHYIEALRNENKGTFPKGCKVIFKVLAGSQSYKLATPTSDIDIKGVYVQDNWMIGTMDDYKPFYRANDDEMYFEIKYFVELLLKGDAGALEMLYSPKECIVHQSYEILPLIEIRDTFITKKLYYTFANYAMGQFKLATNYNRKANWEEERFTEKSPAHFTTFLRRVDGRIYKFSEYLASLKYPEDEVTLVKIDGMANTYKAYFYKTRGWYGPNSNDLRAGAIPKERNEEWFGIVNFNHSEYSRHMKDVKEYKNWLAKRSEERFNTNKAHAQKYDAKNIMHMVRLIMTASEIPVTKTIRLDRTLERDFLLSIKYGEVKLKEILDEWLEKGKDLQETYTNSDLPDEANIELAKRYLRSVRLKNTRNFKF